MSEVKLKEIYQTRTWKLVSEETSEEPGGNFVFHDGLSKQLVDSQSHVIKHNWLLDNIYCILYCICKNGHRNWLD